MWDDLTKCPKVWAKISSFGADIGLGECFKCHPHPLTNMSHFFSTLTHHSWDIHKFIEKQASQEIDKLNITRNNCFGLKILGFIWFVN
jgi:hypothetical protein